MILNWQNVNRYRAYPFKEDALLTDVTQTLTIPNNFLLDFFATYYSAAEADVVLKTIDVALGGTAMTVTFLVNGTTPAAIMVPASALFPFEGEFVVQVGSSTTIRVNPVFGPGVTEILTEPSYQGNIYTFTAPIEQSTVASPYKHSLTKIVAKNIDVNDNEILLPDVGEGDITFIRGYNSIITSDNIDTITFGARVGAGAGQPCDPIYDAIDCSCGIYFINGKHPDWLGNFKFEGGKYIIVTNDPDTFTVKIKTTVRDGTPTCQDPADEPDRLPPDSPDCPDGLPATLPTDFCSENTLPAGLPTVLT
jgi:hypothetical protein